MLTYKDEAQSKFLDSLILYPGNALCYMTAGFSQPQETYQGLGKKNKSPVLKKKGWRKMERNEKTVKKKKERNWTSWTFYVHKKK